MYASDYSKKAITVDEKIAELMMQRADLQMRLSVEELLRKQEKDNYQCAMIAAMNVEKKLKGDLEEAQRDYDEASRVLASTRLLAAKSMDEIRAAVGAPLSGDDKSLKRAVDYVRELKADNALLREANEKAQWTLVSLEPASVRISKAIELLEEVSK